MKLHTPMLLRRGVLFLEVFKMKEGCKKYIPFKPVELESRTWPCNKIERAPTWCSVDLRDGNQALIDPMNLPEKLEMFKTLCAIGIKEIEVGFPSASETEYEILRALIDGGYIPDDVKIQVLVQSREHLIRKTFEAIKGAKNVIFHFYNSTSALQRKVVFHTDKRGVTDIAVNAAKLIKQLGDEAKADGTNIIYEYSPESFMGTETDFAADICAAVMDALGANENNKVILNLPSTVESSTPNLFADQIEYFCRCLPHRENAIISLHPHNDRGTAVAAAELGMLAGAERIEGTLFGNGERTGNVDLITLALNLYTQGIDPELDLHDINAIKDIYERTTHMHVEPRHPYSAAVAGRIGGDGYRVRILINLDIRHERHIAVAVKVADSVGGLVIFARGKEVAVFHRLFDIRFVVLGQDEELERSADLVELFGIVIGKSPDISALGDNDLEQFIPELAVAAGDSVGVVDYLHAEAARAVDEYAREIGYVDVPVRTVRESAAAISKRQ